MYISFQLHTYLLLAECEVRTASYGPSFFLPFMAQARSVRAMKTRKEKTRKATQHWEQVGASTQVKPSAYTSRFYHNVVCTVNITKYKNTFQSKNITFTVIKNEIPWKSSHGMKINDKKRRRSDLLVWQFLSLEGDWRNFPFLPTNV